MAVRELSTMTWEEARALDGVRAVAVLPVGALEAHGPHLPLATDIIIAEAMARAGAERLSASGYDVLLLPPLAYTPAPFAAAFPGTISVGPETIAALVTEIARGLAAQGVRVLALANAHFDPAHVQALRTTAERIAAEGAVRVAFPDLTRRRWAERLTDEFRSGACHAGRYESSIVLAERPELVRESLRSALAPVWHSLSQAIAEGKRTFQEAGGAHAYFGDPASASAAEGRETVRVLGEILAEAVGEVSGSSQRGQTRG